jgi:succinate dehydrogenase/fumarate reductase flavoprotein subunit
LRPALAELDELWTRLRTGAAAGPAATPRLRQAAAMVAHARWMYTSALARTESRGMSRREEYPDLDPAQRRRLTVGGLDEVWVRPESAPAARPEPAVAS